VLLPQEVLDALAAMSLKTIVEIAVDTDDLSLLVDALAQADAGLVETLSGEGPFTVFAPTNAAFVHLLNTLGDDYNSLSDFDTDEEKELLVKVLTYHVIVGTAAFSSSLTDGQMIETFQGENVSINIKDGLVHIEDATEMNASVALADVENITISDCDFTDNSNSPINLLSEETDYNQTHINNCLFYNPSQV
jgi:uncharacterized surface protein with fasciclin (FAS1) repeats